MEFPLLLTLFLLGSVGSVTGIAALVRQFQRERVEERERAQHRARTVTATWVDVQLSRPDPSGSTTQRGVLVHHHGRLPVRSVTITATADGRPCAVPALNPLLPGETFLRMESGAADAQFSAQRLGGDVTAVLPLSDSAWRVTRVSFFVEALNVVWTPELERA